MSESSIPDGTEPLTQSQAVDHLLSTPAPEEASDTPQEPVAEAQAEAPLVDEVESDDAVELSEEETEEADVEYEATEDEDEQPLEASEESDDVEEYYTVKIDGEEEPSLTFVFFNVTSRTFTWNKLSKVKDNTLNDNLDSVLLSYNPDNCTALYDTLHNVFTEFEHEENNIVAIFTDGEDNSSRKPNVKQEVKVEDFFSRVVFW